MSRREATVANPETPRGHRVLAVLLLVFAISCATRTDEGLDAPELVRTVTADGVVLHLGVDSEALAERSRAAALLGQEVFREQLGVSPFTAEVPLVVNLYRDHADFRMASQSEDDASHFVLLPRTDEEYLEMVQGAGAATLDALWFEIARQGILRVAKNRSLRWPEWFKAGLAECLVLECWRSDYGYPDVEPLWWTTERLLVSDAARAWRLTPLKAFLRLDRADAPDDDLYVARAATFCWFLKQEQVRWMRLLDEVAGISRAEHRESTLHATRRFNAGLEEIYGDIDRLEVRMLETIEQSEERWIGFSGYPERSGDGFLLAAEPDGDAAIRRRVLPGRAFDLEFDCLRLDAGPSALHIFFAMDSVRPQEFILLGINDDGTLTVDQLHNGAFAETITYAFDTGFLEPGVWTRVQVLVTDRHLEVVVGDLLLLNEEVPISPSTTAEYIGIGSELGIHEVRDIVHRSRPALK